MVLYVLCLHPLLLMIEQRLSDIKIGRRARPTSVLAYADDITIFVTSTCDFPIIEDATRQYGKASGALLIPQKSKVLVVGTWDSPETVLVIKYHPHVKILGISFWSSIDQSMNDSWARLTGRIRLQAKNSYYRDLCIAHGCASPHLLISKNLVHCTYIYSP